jgi:hypothetical protein
MGLTVRQQVGVGRVLEGGAVSTPSAAVGRDQSSVLVIL